MSFGPQVSSARLAEYGAVELANSVTGLVKLGHSPDPYWLDAAIDQAGRVLGAAGPEELCTLLYGLASLGAQSPSDAWLDMTQKVLHQQ